LAAVGWSSMGSDGGLRWKIAIQVTGTNCSMSMGKSVASHTLTEIHKQMWSLSSWKFLGYVFRKIGPRRQEKKRDFSKKVQSSSFIDSIFRSISLSKL
jgi:hypothetical protein